MRRITLPYLLSLILLLGLTACDHPDGQAAGSVAQPSSESAPHAASGESGETTESVSPASSASSAQTAASTDAKPKILIAYFSQAGEQYDVGVVQKGSTQIVAEMIASETGGELFHIKRAEAYPDTYDKLTDTAKKETGTRPKLAAAVDNWSDCDIVFLGYPIWWGDMPMPVYTFLDSYDWRGKTVIPFDTNGGSGLAGTMAAIGKATGLEPLEGLAISGRTAQSDQSKTLSMVQGWLSRLGY